MYVSERKKLRVRWYNDDFNNVYFEKKNKRNFFVWKDIEKVKSSFSKTNLIYKLQELLSKPNNIIDSNNNYNLILKTNYKRNYWISSNGKIRATIDIDINTSPVQDMNKIITLPETILEFKFSPSSENYFRDFFSHRGLNIRSKKYSKYLQSFIALEESGLIN